MTATLSSTLPSMNEQAVSSQNASQNTSQSISQNFASQKIISQQDEQSLLRGDVLISTTTIGTGAAVTATMYVPLVRSQTWQKLTEYSNWVHYFPDIVHSQVLEVKKQSKTHPMTRRLYQVARKAFLMFSAQVEIYLQVIETVHQKIQFRLEQGNFSDFAADLTLEDYGQGTLITYSVKATPLIPVPSFLIEQAIRHDLPGNMKMMRQVMCAA